MGVNTKIYKITKLNPSISSENVGDHIISQYCDDIFLNMFGEALYVNIPTREKLSDVSRRHVATSDYSFVCGTNLLASNMWKWKQWNINILEALDILNTNVRKKEYLFPKKVCSKYENNKLLLFGVGWWQYQEKPDIYTKCLLKLILHRKMIHSVRDSYTENMLKSIGIDNVLNTSCPTMWKLTETFCKTIPIKKSRKVVTTLTNYNMSKDKDEILLDILLRNYEQVFVWLQAIEDQQYLFTLKQHEKVKIIYPNLLAYDRFLDESNVDYVGTRLHGGIHALNKRKRTVILAVDNRALEIAKDTNLPVIRRENIETQLEKWIQGSNEVKISLPHDNIERWIKQFGF